MRHLDRLIVCATAPRIGTTQSWQDHVAPVEDQGLAPLAKATTAQWFILAFRTAQPDRAVQILSSFIATSVLG